MGWRDLGHVLIMTMAVARIIVERVVEVAWNQLQNGMVATLKINKSSVWRQECFGALSRGQIKMERSRLGVGESRQQEQEGDGFHSSIVGSAGSRHPADFCSMFRCSKSRHHDTR